MKVNRSMRNEEEGSKSERQREGINLSKQENSVYQNEQKFLINIESSKGHQRGRKKELCEKSNEANC
jgi:hypothetical protein